MSAYNKRINHVFVIPWFDINTEPPSCSKRRAIAKRSLFIARLTTQLGIKFSLAILNFFSPTIRRRINHNWPDFAISRIALRARTAAVGRGRGAGGCHCANALVKPRSTYPPRRTRRPRAPIKLLPLRYIYFNIEVAGPVLHPLCPPQLLDDTSDAE